MDFIEFNYFKIYFPAYPAHNFYPGKPTAIKISRRILN